MYDKYLQFFSRPFYNLITLNLKYETPQGEVYTRDSLE